VVEALAPVVVGVVVVAVGVVVAVVAEPVDEELVVPDEDVVAVVEAAPVDDEGVDVAEWAAVEVTSAASPTAPAVAANPMVTVNRRTRALARSRRSTADCVDPPEW
jgi:hypothetical protein